ncbi:GTPase [Aquitalea sp. ASV15]|uniref:GTPase n=1 Tax=Aquitalea sp. ASV15 TaxID=2795104 RepID=UPI0018EC6082|nr:GTPase [Aquitalea sp. ASV15]
MNNAEMLEEIFKVIGKIPDVAKNSDTFKELAKNLQELKQILIEKRAPRLAVVGRRGAGKSSLFNALVDEKILLEGELDTTKECLWQEYKLQNGGTIDWMDTPGLGAEQFKIERLKMLQDQFIEKRPDIVIFIHKASEVDSEIDATLDDLRKIMECTVVNGEASKMLVVLNQVDALPSPKDIEPPYALTKREKISALTEKMMDHLNRKSIIFEKTIPVASYFDEECDLRFNMGVLAIEISRIVPTEAMLEASASLKYKQLREEVANKIINIFSLAAAAIAALPMPVADIVPLTALQALMVSTIGYLGGKKLSELDLKEFFVSLGLLVGVATTARQLAKILFPVLGEGISAAVAGATTKGIGAAAVSYFINGESMDVAKKKFKKLS